MTYQTNNPVGSVDVRDLYDNAEAFDNFSAGPLDAYPDRFGVSRQSLQGIRNASQYVILGPYAAGLQFTAMNQVFSYLGEFYAPGPAITLPYTTTGVGAAEIANFRSVGDAVLRQELANGSSYLVDSAVVGYKGLTVYEMLDDYPENYGAVGDGIADDRVAYQAWLDSRPEFGLAVHKPGSVYKLVNGVAMDVRGVQLVGNGAKIYYPQTDEIFYHCIRVNADDCAVEDVYIYSDNGLVRDDTGFGISIFDANNTRVEGCTLLDIASAAIWVTNSTGVIIAENNILYPKADGIHLSDGSRNFTVSGNTLTGTADDSIAVVGDVHGDGLTPQQGSVTGNTVDGTFSGHGVVLIACDTITVTGNTIRGTSAAGIGSYFWNLGGAPIASDWANSCVVSDNLIVSPGISPTNADNVCGIFAGAFRNSRISGNTITGTADETLALTSVIRVTACQGLTIQGNQLRDSASYGVLSPDANLNNAENFTGLFVIDNLFINIAKEVVRIMPAAATVGRVLVSGNELVDCVYDGATANATNISKTGANQLGIIGNVNVTNNKTFSYDVATCTNLRVESNSPATLISFVPVIAPMSGAWTTASATGSYYMEGRTVNFGVTVTITTEGTGNGLTITLPKPARGGNSIRSYTGRENVLTGVPVFAYNTSTTVINVITVANGDPITGNGANVSIQGSYLSD